MLTTTLTKPRPVGQRECVVPLAARTLLAARLKASDLDKVFARPRAFVFHHCQEF